MGLTAEYLHHPTVFKSFLTKEEINVLYDFIFNAYTEGSLVPDAYPAVDEKYNSVGRPYRDPATRFTLPFGRIDYYNQLPLLKEIEQRVKNKINIYQYKWYSIDPSLGYIASIMEPGSYIHKHKDPYAGPRVDGYIPTRHKTCRHIRFNIMVSRGESPTYNPHFVLNKQELSKYIGIGDAWCFPSDITLHFMPRTVGSEYRVVYQFGFAIDTGEQ